MDVNIRATNNAISSKLLKKSVYILIVFNKARFEKSYFNELVFSLLQFLLPADSPNFIAAVVHICIGDMQRKYFMK